VFGNLDEFAKILIFLFSVIPAKAGIQLFQGVLDPGVRRGDGLKDFLRARQSLLALFILSRRKPG
jgi:hypothetical protein